MQQIYQKRVVPVVTLEKVEDAVPVAEALLAGGLDLVEITFRTSAAEHCLREIKNRFPQMLVGAGTVLEVEQLQRARAAGAEFGVSPGLNETVVRAAHELGMVFLPGVMTPTEVERALGLGCKLLKFFPASVAGGVEMLRALAGPYEHTGVKFIPLGGVNASNAAEYLRLPTVAAVGGSWIADKKTIAEKNWAQITELAKEILGIVADLAR
ncbi:MAG: bifunctional 4-hydroxy-2-oxoglutarate aldolase/2-dehydro-3-deoxy-phosphogluconate aldolase [Verrucomicrobiae bacterium]|nr:bifunctional 4-hydroxy-2-oxoglutarate aldolase/2-dehydro-3-deoxy-phosphogluconate aldolase [Verrucomicrobiae bacterium]